MIKEGKYTLSELSEILRESTNEFKPKKGPKVDSENAKNNEKAVSDILKATEKFDGGPRKEDKTLPKAAAYNPSKTTLDVRLDYDPGDGWKERTQAQVEGYPSKQNKDATKDSENAHINRETNKKWYQYQKERNATLNDKHKEIKHAGLTSRMFPEKDFENETPFKNESKTMKRLHFKNTKFLSESQMLSRIPEEYKTDGNVFIMRDATGTDYMVECHIDDTFGYTQLNVLNKVNKQSVNEELNRMRKLYEYNSEDTLGSVKDNDMECIMEKVRDNMVNSK